MIARRDVHLSHVCRRTGGRIGDVGVEERGGIVSRDVEKVRVPFCQRAVAAPDYSCQRVRDTSLLRVYK